MRREQTTQLNEKTISSMYLFLPKVYVPLKIGKQQSYAYHVYAWKKYYLQCPIEDVS